jgi:hypothetical protein
MHVLRISFLEALSNKGMFAFEIYTKRRIFTPVIIFIFLGRKRGRNKLVTCNCLSYDWDRRLRILRNFSSKKVQYLRAPSLYKSCYQTFTFEVPFCIVNILFLRHISYDLPKIHAEFIKIVNLKTKSEIFFLLV